MDQNNIDKLFNSHLKLEREFEGREQVWSSLEPRLKDNRKYYLLFFFGAALFVFFGTNKINSNKESTTQTNNQIEEIIKSQTELNGLSNNEELKTELSLNKTVINQSDQDIQNSKFLKTDITKGNTSIAYGVENNSSLNNQLNIQLPQQFNTKSDDRVSKKELSSDHTRQVIHSYGHELLTFDPIPTLKNFHIENSESKIDLPSVFALKRTSTLNSKKNFRFSLGAGLNHRFQFDNNIMLSTPTNMFGRITISYKQNWAIQFRIDPLETNTLLKSYDSNYNLELPYSPFQIEDIESITIQQKKLRLSVIAQRKIFSAKRHKVMLNAGFHLANSSESDVTYAWQTVYGQQEVEQVLFAESIHIDNVSIGIDANFSIMPILDIVGKANYHHPVKNRVNNWNNELNLSIGLRMSLN